jgi:hypothetical protein
MSFNEINNEEFNADQSNNWHQDLETTGEDWEYESCSWHQVACEVEGFSTRAFAPSEF